MEIDDKYKWLYDDMTGLKEKINFRNRTEYRVNGKIHNSKGPAIIEKSDMLFMTKPSDTDYEKYYINGKRIEFDEWLIYNRQHKIKRLIKLGKKNGE